MSNFIPESIFRNHDDRDHHHNLFPASSPHDFHGVPDFMMRRSMSFSGVDRGAEDDEGSDDGSQLMLGEKKRRLNLEQVKALEKSFDSGNKLEPERKMQLARALGLQPRQIAIWFQNRRARWKTKQLEKDYDVLRRQFDALKADNDALKSQNKNLQSQLLNMKSRDHHHSTPIINLNKDNEGSNWSNGSENSCDHEVNLNAIESSAMLHHHNRHDQSNKGGVAFPSPMNTVTPGPTSLTHLLHSSTRQDHHPRKFNNVGSISNDQCFGNVMFGGIEENPEFWPWPGQENFE